jgi:valyl-tRNA synthetase
MTETLSASSTQYEPSATEAKWQTAWEQNHAFQADVSKGGEPYCVVIPPPNVTGSLHMGHAFESALIDTLVRYHRMTGRNTLWLPGTDHASIAVSTIIDNKLKAEDTTRQTIGREAYLDRAWQWKTESGGTIVNQLRRLGVSVDWSRERFTMDEGLSKAVLEAFVRFYDEGLIYRGNYMVNWCPASQSAVSDLEVENKEVEGHLWHFRYPLANGSGHIEVATTRPETMLGDTAVAVNPEDDRYKHLIGKTIKLPIMDREIPIIGDEAVDIAFGTGCVKITPAHDLNDFAMGQRHDLPFINILNKDGTINENGGPFEGLDRFEARKEVIDWLQNEGVLVKIEDYKHTVPYSDRGKVPVEPLISTQWFVKIEPIAQKTLAFLDEEQAPKFVPERWGKVYRDWLVNLKDWCISRQLWWGHQIPAWYAISETEGEIRDNTPFVVAKSEAEAWEKAVAQFGDQVRIQQDPDVLDTWFSSGLWPFSTLGWPEQTEDLTFYYPTTTLVTGFDIIFFWVARMALMASHFTGEIPFKDVYIHGLVRDENGKKMSKSSNNGIDPLLLITKYGTDALRYTLIREVAGAGQDISLEYNRETDESKSVEASRNFANKLWNASRFVMMNLKGQTPAQLGIPNQDNLELADRWILEKYERLVSQTRSSIDNYGLGEAAKNLYEFIWGDFCDWYIELVKPRLRQDDSPSRLAAQQTLAYVLEGTLKLLHPFMPHVTEEIWHTLTQASDDQFLALQLYPEAIAPVVKISLGDDPWEKSEPEFSASAAPSLTQAKPSVPSQSNTILTLLAEPERLIQWALQYRSILLIGLVVFVALIGVNVLDGVISTLNAIPFVENTLELFGLFYLGQFIYKNLLWSDRRQAFTHSVNQERQKIIKSIREGSSDSSSQASEVLEDNTAVLALQRLRAIKNSDRELVATAAPVSLNIEAQFELIFDTIRIIRNLRQEASIKPGLPIAVTLQSESDRERMALTNGQGYIKDLAKVVDLTITGVAIEDDLKQTIVGITGTVQVFIPLAGVIDIDVLRAKLEKDLAKAEKDVESFKVRLQNKKFVDQAPPIVVQGARETLAEAEKQVEILRDRLARL